MATRMQQRRGTAVQFSTINPVLADGEIGFTTDTRVIKIGDGVTAWNSLAADFLTRSIMDATGDLLVGSGADAVTRLARGTTGQILSVKADGTLEWVTPTNPYTVVDAAEDLIVGSGADAVKRLAKGSVGQQLKISAGGLVAWETPPATDLSSRVAKAGDTMTGPLILKQGANAGARLDNATSGALRVVSEDGSAYVDVYADELRGQSVWDNGNRVYSSGNPPPGAGTVVSQTGTYAVAAGVGVVLANGTFTVTIPAAASNSGRVLNVKNTGTGTITVVTSGGTIDGETTLSIEDQYHSITVVSDGTNWFII